MPVRVPQRTMFGMQHEGCEILVGDALRVLLAMEAEQFRCCVNLPPCPGLRGYDASRQSSGNADGSIW